MPAQQHAQQVGRVPDEFRREVEDVPQREVLGRVVAEPARPVPLPRAVERVEVAPVEHRDDGMAEGGEQVAQAEGQTPAGLQQVVGQHRQVAPFGPHDDFGAGAFAPVPPRPEPRFVAEAERRGVVERDDFEPPLAQGFLERGFEQQPVGVGRQGEGRGARRERLQDTVAPVGHRAPAVRERATVESADGACSTSRR